MWTVELGRAIRRHFLASLCLSLPQLSFVITRWRRQVNPSLAFFELVPPRMGDLYRSHSRPSFLLSFLPSSSWNGLLTTDSVSAAAAIYPSRFLFEPKMSNDSSRRRRRLFPLAFQHFSRPHRLNLRERAPALCSSREGR